jgi:hypothetical protein
VAEAETAEPALTAAGAAEAAATSSAAAMSRDDGISVALNFDGKSKLSAHRLIGDRVESRRVEIISGPPHPYFCLAQTNLYSTLQPHAWVRARLLKTQAANSEGSKA